MNLESFRSTLYEIRDLATGGTSYACNIMDDKDDASFCISMFSVIARNAVLKLFDLIEFLPEIEAVNRKIEHEYRTAGNA